MGVGGAPHERGPGEAPGASNPDPLGDRRPADPLGDRRQPDALGEGRQADPLGDRGRIVAGVVVAVLYAVSFLLRGSVAPGLVGGALAGVLVFLLLREAEARRRRRHR